MCVCACVLSCKSGEVTVDDYHDRYMLDSTMWAKEKAHYKAVCDSLQTAVSVKDSTHREVRVERLTEKVNDTVYVREIVHDIEYVSHSKNESVRENLSVVDSLTNADNKVQVKNVSDTKTTTKTVKGKNTGSVAWWWFVLMGGVAFATCVLGYNIGRKI